MSTQFFLPPSQAWTFHRLPALLRAAGVTPRAVLHIGAHHGEEVAVYRSCGFEQIRLVEPDPRNLRVLRDTYGGDPDIQIIAAAVATEPGRGVLHFAERTVWSGLLPHPTATGRGVEVDTVTLDAIQGDANLLVIDTQGSELAVLRTADLSTLDMVIVETTRRQDDSAAPYYACTQYMSQPGWWVIEEWVHDGSGYTDTVFVPPR